VEEDDVIEWTELRDPETGAPTSTLPCVAAPGLDPLEVRLVAAEEAVLAAADELVWLYEVRVMPAREDLEKLQELVGWWREARAAWDVGAAEIEQYGGPARAELDDAVIAKLEADEAPRG